MLVMLTDRGHILLQKKEDILSVLSNPSLEKRGICTLPLVMSFGISKEPILMIPRAAAWNCPCKPCNQIHLGI